jgi:hypothetical protein
MERVSSSGFLTVHQDSGGRFATGQSKKNA